MDERFRQRRRELEAECRIPARLFSQALERLTCFLKPFLADFRRREQRAHVLQAIQGLCSGLERKNNESVAYLFGLDRKAIQHFVGEVRWDDAPLRKTLAEQIGQQFGQTDGIIVFDPSAFPKKGSQSVGVARQWCGRLGKIDNCQVGVYMAYVTRLGHALVDSELFLPKEWTTDRWRLKAAKVPKTRWRHRTRHELCLDMLQRHQSRLPHRWITGDDEMGRSTDFRRVLRERQEQYLLAVPSNTLIRDLEVPEPIFHGKGRPPKRPHSRADRWQREQPKEAWIQVNVCEGEKGPIVVEALAHRVASSKRGRENEAEEMLVVIRSEDRDSKVTKTDYYLSNAPPETPLQEFCRVARAEHRVEECFHRAKGQAGLADYEVRHWIGWQHHQTLSLMACWFLTQETQRAEKKDTRDHTPPGPARDCFRPAVDVGFRFDPGPPLSNRAETATKPTRQALPLETT